MAGNSQRFCMELFIPSSEGGGRRAPIRQDLANARVSGLASIIGRLWEPDRTLRVRFLEGDPALRRRVQEYAEQWNGYANIRFAFVVDGNAEIRVAFVPGDASWSAVGTDALYFPKQAPTMNFGWLTPESSDEEVRAIVLHEFGHALGLIHEHQNPEAAIQWNEAAVISDLSQPPNNWTIEQIRDNVLSRYDPSRSAATAIDVDSVMRFPIPASWTHGTFSSDFYGDLSPRDKEFIRALYPGARDHSPPRPVMVTPDESFDFGISGAVGRGTRTPVAKDGARVGPDATPPTVTERVVNTGFALQTSPIDQLAPTTPLASDQSYYFWMEIGRLDPTSIEETPVPLPTEHLPPEARLRVALFSFADELEITPGRDVGELQLRRDGSVVVARQPVEAGVIQVPDDLLQRRLFFPVRTPDRAGTFRVRCNIYYEQVLVQSRLIRARVMRHPHEVERALRSRLDYTLSRSLAPAQLAAMQPHRLSLMLNDNGDGTHGFRFLGEQEFKNEASFDGNELQDLIDQTRGALRLAAWGDDDPWKDQAYRYEGQLDQDRLRKDLIRFAIRGYRFYDAVINRLSGDAREAEKLAALMRESGLVQIASKESTRLVLPAAMIYDYAFDTNADSAVYTLCPDFLAAVTNPTPLEEVPCFKSSCPHATQEDNETLICPSGFWGYRHAIGMPLSVATAPDAPSVIAAPGGPQVAVGVSTDANFVMRADHERALQGLRAGLDWNYADTRQTTLELLKTTRSHIIYFYCHGGMANDIPYIQVGPLTERGITRDTLRYKKIRWDEPRPLVFINGCHTTALEPEQALEFVSALVENTGASGVIGTEITIFEPLATQFAKHCLDCFLDGAPVGAAVRSARLALLKDGNPLGLVYLPFAMADLRLVEAPPVA